MRKRKRKPTAYLSVSPNSTPDAIVIQFKRCIQRELIPRKMKEKRAHEPESIKRYKAKKAKELLNKDIKRRLRRLGAFSNMKRMRG